MGINFASLEVDLFLFCSVRDFTMSLPDEKQSKLLKHSARRFDIWTFYLILTITTSMVCSVKFILQSFNQIKQILLKLKPYLFLLDGFISFKKYDKRDDFDFEIVNFPYLDGGVPRRASYSVHISQLIRFARVFSYLTDFNT